MSMFISHIHGQDIGVYRHFGELHIDLHILPSISAPNHFITTIWNERRSWSQFSR